MKFCKHEKINSFQLHKLKLCEQIIKNYILSFKITVKQLYNHGNDINFVFNIRPIFLFFFFFEFLSVNHIFSMEKEEEKNYSCHTRETGISFK